MPYENIFKNELYSYSKVIKGRATFSLRLKGEYYGKN
jgi:hypothetical protein